MIAGLLWMGLANAASLLGAHEILRRVRTGEACLDGTLFLILRLTLLTAAVLLAGMAGLLRAAPLGLAGAVALAALVAAGAHRRLPALSGIRIGRTALIVAGVLVARLLLQAWIFAPFVGDTLTYHLPKVAEWASHGGFTREFGGDARATFPAGFEAVETWWVVFLHHDVLVELAGIEFLLLASVATAALARRLGLSDRASFFAAIMVALTPGLHFQALGCLNDAPAAALVVSTAALVAARAHPGLLLLAAGIGVGIKPTYLYALPGIAFLAILERKRSRLSIPSVQTACSMAVLGLAAGAFWYLRNLVIYGNPVYPMGTPAAVFPTGEPIQQVGPSLRSLVVNGSNLVNISVYDRVAPFGAMMKGISGWGPAAFACGFVALLLAVRSEPGFRRVAAGFGVSVLSVMILVQTDLWFMRFLLFVPALLALSVAWLSDRLPGLVPLFLMLLVLQFVVTSSVPEEFPLGHVSELAGRSWRDRSRGPIVPSEPKDDSIGCLVPGGRWAYLLYRPDFSRRVVYLREKTAAGVLEAMRRERLDVLYAPMNSALLEEAVKRGDVERQVGFFYRRLR